MTVSAIVLLVVISSFGISAVENFSGNSLGNSLKIISVTSDVTSKLIVKYISTDVVLLNNVTVYSGLTLIVEVVNEFLKL